VELSDPETGVSGMPVEPARNPPGWAGDVNDQPIDLIGWVTDPRLAGVEPQVESGFARELLATAMGVPTSRLDALDDGEVEVALERLRGLIRQLQRLAAQAAVDDLTGALRRGAGLEALGREIARFRRFGGKGLAAIFVDVDHLKRVNDTEGHPAGDALLAAVVETIRERLRAYDLIIRWGGDEFVCVLPDTSAGEAERTVADIDEQVRARTRGRSVSIGLVVLEPGDDAASLVGRADSALYARRNAARAQG
jgi:diguanylate cyclase (GGDEF)-like protein